MKTVRKFISSRLICLAVKIYPPYIFPECHDPEVSVQLKLFKLHGFWMP